MNTELVEFLSRNLEFTGSIQDPQEIIDFNHSICYFRFPCFEPGPEWYYLFRFKIRFEILGKSVRFQRKDFFPNRYVLGEWIDHKTTVENQSIVVDLDDEKWKKIEKGILYVKVDEVADMILYQDEKLCPDFDPFEHFPSGFEKLGLTVIAKMRPQS